MSGSWATGAVICFSLQIPPPPPGSCQGPCPTEVDKCHLPRSPSSLPPLPSRATHPPLHRHQVLQLMAEIDRERTGYVTLLDFADVMGEGRAWADAVNPPRAYLSTQDLSRNTPPPLPNRVGLALRWDCKMGPPSQQTRLQNSEGRRIPVIQIHSQLYKYFRLSLFLRTSSKNKQKVLWGSRLRYLFNTFPMHRCNAIPRLMTRFHSGIPVRR